MRCWDACLAQDKNSRVACETYVKSNIAIVGGENYDQGQARRAGHHARRRFAEIGYVNDDDVFFTRTRCS